MKTDYGTATSEEIGDGFKVAMYLAKRIKDIPSPAVRNMVKELIALIRID